MIQEDIQAWQDLLLKALPVVDYTFNMVTSKLDLSTASGKSLAVNELMPVIARMKDTVRQDHYLTKLAKLTEISYNKIEAVLKDYISKQKAKKPSKKPETRTLQPLLSNPLEEYCLTLLLQHPELKDRDEGLLAEYFQNSENREIFTAWQQAADLPSLKDQLDPAIWEHLDSLINNKDIPTDRIEQRYTDYVLNLSKRFLQNSAARTAEMLALEAEAGGSAAELAKLEEEGIEISTQLREVFAQKGRAKRSTRDESQRI